MQRPRNEYSTKAKSKGIKTDSLLSESEDKFSKLLDRGKVIKEIKDAYKLALRHSSESLGGYLHHVVIDSRPEAKQFKDIAEYWQWLIAGKIAPALESVAGLRKGYAGPTRFWLTLPRGHDKTSSIGRFSNWLLAFASRRLSCICAAGDREQASRLADFMKAEASLNPWLDDRLSFANYFVRGTNESKLQIISADANSSFGDKSDVVICDELTHWEKGDLWNALYSGSEKRPGSVYIVITNAGLMHSWQWEQLQNAKRNKDWYVFEAPGPLSTYMSPARVAQLASEMPRSLAARVIFNKWLDPAEGCGFVTRAEAQACEDLGEQYHLLPQIAGTGQHQYVASVDYGPSKDRTVLCIAHKVFAPNGGALDGVIVIDRMDVFEGKMFGKSGDGKSRVPVAEVDQWVDEAVRDFGGTGGITIVVDPYQMESSIQRYEGFGYKVRRFEPRGGKSNHLLATTLASLVQNRRLAWPKGVGGVFEETPFGGTREHTLVDEFAELITKTMGYGLRIDHLPNKHDDRVVALGMAAVHLAQEAQPVVNYDDERWF